jgi:putative ATPase
MAPKSNALYTAYENAAIDAQETFAAPVPLHIRNAPTKLMQELDYGKNYQYAHNYEDKITAMKCLPDELRDRKYYRPTNEGREAKIKERLDSIDSWRDREEDR